MVIDLYIGTDKLDLFKDENINLSSSIADVSDITKNTTDFTKSFTVPASDNNNNIFKHYYDANIDGGFDARIKQDGKIELDGIPFKIGKWRLNSVKIKNGLPNSYNINFWGNLVSLKDVLQNDELSVLDLSDCNHEYTPANVQTGLTSSLFSDTVIYNLLAKKRYYYSSDADNTQTDEIANICYAGGADTGIVWKDLRPSIKLIKLIEAIEDKYTVANGYEQDIIFSRDFFGSSQFDNLYMWLDDEEEALTSPVQIEFDNAGDIEDSGSTFNITENYYVSGDYSALYLEIRPSAGFGEVKYSVDRYLDGAFHESSPTDSGDRNIKFWAKSITDKKHTFFIKTDVSFDFTLTFKEVPYPDTYTALMSEQSISVSVKPNELMPQLKTIDFLKGLFSMFKLVVIPQNDGTIYVNTLKDYYANGDILDVTEFVDVNNYEVARGDILNEIMFKFQEPSTILNKQFKENTGFYYGDSETFLYDDNGKLLDGDDLEIELPFEQVIYERLTDDFADEETNIQYGAIIDENLSATTIKPHIFYNINTAIGTKTIGFIDDAGVQTELTSNYNAVSHVNDNNTVSFSTVFSNEFNEYTGEEITKTLYYNYYLDYINSIFNIKRRNYTYKANNFPLRLLTELSLNDILKIRDNYYRIDKYDLNLLTGVINFKLINLL